MKSIADSVDKFLLLENTKKLREAIENAEAVLIGAGAGLSTSAGFTYTGERFQKYFSDFIAKYHFCNMYEGGFYCFQKAGFLKERLFYTQGDFGLFQCSEPCHDKTYDNEDTVRQMVLSQGFQIDESDTLLVQDNCNPSMKMPSNLVPKCPVCEKPMSMNLRADSTFVQDEGWYAAAKRYEQFIRSHEKAHVLYLELGVGMNTPGNIKYPFWQMTAKNSKAVYICVNKGEVFIPTEIENRSMGIDEDIYSVITVC